MSWLKDQEYPNYEVHQRLSGLAFQGKRTQETKLTITFHVEEDGDGCLHAWKGQNMLSRLDIKGQTFIFGNVNLTGKPVRTPTPVDELPKISAADPDAFWQVYDWVRSML